MGRNNYLVAFYSRFLNPIFQRLPYGILQFTIKSDFLIAGSWQRDEHKYLKQDRGVPPQASAKSPSKAISIETVLIPRQTSVISSQAAAISAEACAISTEIEIHRDQSSKKLSRAELQRRYNRTKEEQQQVSSFKLL